MGESDCHINDKRQGKGILEFIYLYATKMSESSNLRFQEGIQIGSLGRRVTR